MSFSETDGDEFPAPDASPRRAPQYREPSHDSLTSSECQGLGDADDPLFHPSGMLLPAWWDVCHTPDGRRFFINKRDKITSWVDPRDELTKKKDISECVGDELPFGWDTAQDPVVGEYFIDHNRKTNQLEDPRVQWRQKQQEMLKEFLREAELQYAEELREAEKRERALRKAEHRYSRITAEVYAGFSDGGLDILEPTAARRARANAKSEQQMREKNRKVVVTKTSSSTTSSLSSRQRVAVNTRSMGVGDDEAIVDPSQQHKRSGDESATSHHAGVEDDDDDDFDFEMEATVAHDVISALVHIVGPSKFDIAEVHAELERARMRVEDLRRDMERKRLELAQQREGINILHNVDERFDRNGTYSVMEARNAVQEIQELRQQLKTEEDEKQKLRADLLMLHDQFGKLDSLGDEGAGDESVRQIRDMLSQRMDALAAATLSDAGDGQDLSGAFKPDDVVAVKLAGDGRVQLQALAETVDSSDLMHVVVPPSAATAAVVAAAGSNSNLRRYSEEELIERAEDYRGMREMAQRAAQAAVGQLHEVEQAKVAGASPIVTFAQQSTAPPIPAASSAAPAHRSGSLTSTATFSAFGRKYSVGSLGRSSRSSGSGGEEIGGVDDKWELPPSDYLVKAKAKGDSLPQKSSVAATAATPPPIASASPRGPPVGSPSPSHAPPFSTIPPPPIASTTRVPSKTTNSVSSTTFVPYTAPLPTFSSHSSSSGPPPPPPMSLSTALPTTALSAPSLAPPSSRLRAPERGEAETVSVSEAVARSRRSFTSSSPVVSPTFEHGTESRAASSPIPSSLPLRQVSFERSLSPVSSSQGQTSTSSTRTLSPTIEGVGRRPPQRGELGIVSISDAVAQAKRTTQANSDNTNVTRTHTAATTTTAAPHSAVRPPSSPSSMSAPSLSARERLLDRSLSGLSDTIQTVMADNHGQASVSSQRTGLSYELDLQAVKMRARESHDEVAHLRQLKNSMERSLSAAVDEVELTRRKRSRDSSHRAAAAAAEAAVSSSPGSSMTLPVSTSSAFRPSANREMDVKRKGGLVHLPSWFFEEKTQKLLGAFEETATAAEGSGASVTGAVTTVPQRTRMSKAELARRKSVKSFVTMKQQQTNDPDALTFRQKMAFFTTGALELPDSVQKMYA